MTDQKTQVSISKELYSNLIGIALTSKTLTDYYKDSDTFKFMVDHAVADLEKKFEDEEIFNIVGQSKSRWKKTSK